MSISDTDTIESVLTTELSHFSNVAFAFLFGSAVSGRLRTDSDLDVAVYGESGRCLEIEFDRVLDNETEVQIALERASNRNIDLLVLNRAPATVCAAALLTGRPLLIRDGSIYTRYFLAVTSVAMDFMQTEREFREIRTRSRSLSELDHSRLERILDLLEKELSDMAEFQDVTLKQYSTDRDLRRNLDRWVEILINAVIDVGKIVLSSEHHSVPQTYGQILFELEMVPHYSTLSGRLGHLAALRNLLAHEYLDIRYGRVRGFIDEGVEAIRDMYEISRKWLRGYAGNAH